MKKIKNWKKIIEISYITGILFIGLYLRIWWILNVPTKQLFDFQTYQEIASNIYNHLGHTFHGHPIAFQGMAYPTVLGYFYKMVGNNQEMTGKIFNVILSTLTILCVYFIFIKLTKRKTVIYTAYTITALLPHYIAYNNVIGTEVFFTFIFVIIILLQIYPLNPMIKYPLLGIMIGMAALTKPFFMAYPVVAACIYWLKNKELKQTAILFLSLSIIMTLIIAPWTYRNYKKFGRMIPISYNSGYVMYINNNGYNTTGAWMPLENVEAPEKVKIQVANILRKKNVKIAHEIEPIIKEEAKGWIVENPVEFLKLGVLRLQATFFSGSWDIDAWTMNDTEKVDVEYKQWDKGEQSYYLRNKNFSRGLRDIIVYGLNTCGLLYILASIKPMILGFIRKDYKLKDEILIPVMNSAFFIAVYFVYEGQSRYSFPLLFLFAFSTAVILEGAMKCMEETVGN